ncbi:MAG: pyridoxal phosphate-dependent aminotransferase [Saprospiraceae bacterium]|nr:pyridoxal phosphate-dependent aminotransferase [Saprospiraceae bacterium]
MEIKLSQRVQQMAESETIKMSQKARDLAAQGHQVINLSLGEPDFDTPQFIKDAATQALADGYTKYTPVPGLPELRKAIQQKFSRDNDLHFGLDEIVVSNGAKQSLANVMLAYLDPGDEAIVFTPYWVSYYEMIRMADAIPVLVSAGIEQDFKVTPQQLKEAITSKTRMLLFSSPCNPTGTVYAKEELVALAEVLKDYPDILVVSDEIYEYINFKGKHFSIGSISHMRDRTVTVNGFAKGFAMTGWRLGYMGAPGWLAKACSKIQSQFTSGANAFGQKAGVTALDSPLDATLEMREQYRRRRDLLSELLGKLPGWKVNKPDGAFYLFPDISAYFMKSSAQGPIRDANDFAEFLLDQAHVATVSGTAFGDDRCIRISYAASEKDLIEACHRIEKAMHQLW